MPHGFCTWLPDDTAAPSTPALPLPVVKSQPKVTTVLRSFTAASRAGYTAFVYIGPYGSSAFCAPTGKCIKSLGTTKSWVAWVQHYGSRAQQLPPDQVLQLHGYDGVIVCNARNTT